MINSARCWISGSLLETCSNITPGGGGGGADKIPKSSKNNARRRAALWTDAPNTRKTLPRVSASLSHVHRQIRPQHLAGSATTTNQARVCQIGSNSAEAWRSLTQIRHPPRGLPHWYELGPAEVLYWYSTGTLRWFWTGTALELHGYCTRTALTQGNPALRFAISALCRPDFARNRPSLVDVGGSNRPKLTKCWPP